MRTGIFISHAHEDQELAKAVCDLLEQALGLSRTDITCTSDASYGLKVGEELGDEIRKRIDGAQALFLLSTPAASQRAWVAYECGYADASREKGELGSTFSCRREPTSHPYLNRSGGALRSC